MAGPRGVFRHVTPEKQGPTPKSFPLLEARRIVECDNHRQILSHRRGTASSHTALGTPSDWLQPHESPVHVVRHSKLNSEPTATGGACTAALGDRPL
jgi:hypothetical protein